MKRFSVEIAVAETLHEVLNVLGCDARLFHCCLTRQFHDGLGR